MWRNVHSKYGIFIGTEGEGGPSGEDVESKKTFSSLVESFSVKVVGEWREAAAAIGHKVHQVSMWNWWHFHW